MRANIVIGCGYGDEGKGSVTNMLCSNVKSPMVIRFSGGQQAGHTVIHEGKKHVFSNYGAGSLKGVPSYFTEHTTFFLNTMANEMLKLKKMGVNPTLTIHPLAKVTTPYDVAYGRLREKRLGHGSVGLGVGATMTRYNAGYKLHAIDLQHPQMFEDKMHFIKKYYLDLLQGDQIAINIFLEDAYSMLRYFMNLSKEKLFQVYDYKYLSFFQNLIFEGSQGVLLDMDHGTFPHVTYANTTSKNAIDVCNKLNLHGTFIEMYYVTRCYQTRHGSGPMTDEGYIYLVNNEEEINVTNEWQKDFRIGELDYDSLNYAIDVDSLYSPSVDRRNLIVTCMDQRPGFEFDVKRMKRNIKVNNIYFSNSPEGKFVKNFQNA